MDTGALARAIRAAVEVQGPPWSATVAGRNRLGTPEQLAADLAMALRWFPSMCTPRRLAALIGESAQESAWFTCREEIGQGGGRHGAHFGRGFIQLTWEDRYRDFSGWAFSVGLVPYPTYFVDHPDHAAGPEYAWLVGAWYFEYFELVAAADAGDWDRVSEMINAGPKSHGYRGPSWPARAAACSAALNHLQGADLAVNEEDELANYGDIIGVIATQVQELHSILGSQTIPRVNELAGEVRDADAITKIKDIHYVLGAQTNPAAEQARDGVRAIHSRIARLERAVAAASPAAAEILASNNEGEQQ